MKKNSVIFYLSLVLVFVQSCRTLNNAATQDDSPKIKSIKEINFIYNDDGTTWKEFEDITYFNENGTEDSVTLLNYDGQHTLISQRFYNKNNKLDSVYFYLNKREVSYISIFEYDNKGNVLKEKVSGNGSVITYHFFYDTENVLVEKKGFDSTNDVKDAVYWHKFVYVNDLIIKDIDLLDEENLTRKYGYNKHGDEVSYLSIKQVEEDGYPTEEVYTTFSDYKYNMQGDWVECKAYSQGSTSKHGVFKELYTREITYY